MSWISRLSIISPIVGAERDIICKVPEYSIATTPLLGVGLGYTHARFWGYRLLGISVLGMQVSGDTTVCSGQKVSRDLIYGLGVENGY